MDGLVHGQRGGHMTASTGVADYLARVRAALADLPPRTRDELLEDLPDHLAEIAAEGDEPLESRLGPPQAYAAELRAAANLDTAGRPATAQLAAALSAARGRLRLIDAKLGPLLGYGRPATSFACCDPGGGCSGGAWPRWSSSPAQRGTAGRSARLAAASWPRW
jgi:hypothetical protein